MKYFVTGATGLIGSRVVEQLHQEGHEVIALTRSRPNADHLPSAVEIVEGDVTNKKSMRRGMSGSDGVFHIAAWFTSDRGPHVAHQSERVNVGGTRNVLELMETLDIPKGVYTGTLAVYPHMDGEPIDETINPPIPSRGAYPRSKWRAQFEVVDPMAAAGIPVVSVQPGIVYGPGERNDGTVRRVMQAYLCGDLRVIPTGAEAPWDHVGDIANAHIRAIDVGEPGERYIISGRPRDAEDIFSCAEAITGIPAPSAIPRSTFSQVTDAMAALESEMAPPRGFEPHLLRFFLGRWPADNSRATDELGISFRNLEDGLREYLAWELEELERAGIPTVETFSP